MSDTQKVTVTNSTKGPRVFNAAPPILLAPGQSSDGEVSVTAAELESMRATGYFEIDGGDAPEPGPLDGSIDELVAHLATLDDVDEAQKLVDAEKAGKSRKGALAALDARLDELSA